MLRKILSLFIFVLLFSVFTISVSAQERINQFKSGITINKSGTIDVVETIVYDFGSQYRHGIFREIPFIKKNEDGKRYVLEVTDISVTDEKNNAYIYTISKEGENLHIKIGDPDKTIIGVNTYVIKYLVSGAITHFSDHDELYWNINGNDWTVPIDAAVSTIKFPKDLKTEEVKLTCFTGVRGSTNADCLANYGLGIADFRSQRAFSSAEGLTIVVGFPKGIVAVVEPKEYVPFWETWYGKVLKTILILIFATLILLWYVVYPIWIIIKWFKYGKDPQVGGPVTAWFDAPKTESGRALTPAETGTLIDEVAQQKEVSALIVDLARRGYLKIEEKKKNDFYLHKTKEYSADRKLLPFEKYILSEIFGKKGDVRLKDEHLFTAVEKVKSDLYESMVKEKFFPKNPQSVRNFYIFITVMAVMTFNLPLFLISLIFGRAMPVKTLAGARAANVAKSLRNFLTSQERQLEFQAKKQLMFEKLLPFAVAFGVEKIWAQRFKDINLKPPEWYSSYQTGAFNSAIFARSLGYSFSSIASAATPTRSSSGFSSGFSGGSSGGGGGGGGGGSW